jgi:transposase
MAAMPTTAHSADRLDALAAQVAVLSSQCEAAQRENAQLRARVAWFERQLFGSKSEKRLIAPDGAQGTLGEAFNAAPETAPPANKRRVAAHERSDRPKQPANDESTLFFDEGKVPVEVIQVPHPDIQNLPPGQVEVIGEKVSHRLAQRPGSYVVLKYVRQVVKRRDTQALSCAPAPAGVIEGSRADVSFIAGLLVDKFRYHLPLYRQHQRLAQAGIKVSRPWLTQLTQSAIALLEPVCDAQW